MTHSHGSHSTLRGVGTDIIEIARIQKAIDRHKERFISHVFTINEIAYCHRYSNPTPHFAGRFAAKEAVLKALGTGLGTDTTWLEIEVLNDVRGRPEVYLSKRLRSRFPFGELFISISHCKLYATAIVIY